MAPETWLTDELIQNTFLYCVKRLHNTAEAEDLSQDILTEALSSYRKNKDNIISPYSWYWKLAHHRYCLYLRRKQYGAVSLEEMGGSLPADLPDLSEGMIAKEELSALNLSLSRLSAIHRETIIRYYLREQTVKQIAEELGIPEGTIKRRLFDAKEQIREDMHMTTTGRSAYAPAELRMQGSYGIPKYWDKLGDLMVHQILIQCRKEARTIREIADEIGVAPVYFEEKMRFLLDNRFLKESGKGKYLTDFFICPEEDYKNFYIEKAKIAAEAAPEVTEILMQLKETICSLPFWGNTFSYGYLLWILYIFAADILSKWMLALYLKEIPAGIPATNGKDYRVSGRVLFPDENVIWPKPEEVHAISWSNYNSHYKTSGYKQICIYNAFTIEPFPERCSWIAESNADLFMRLYDNPQKDLTPTEEETVSFWLSKGFLQKTEDGLFPGMPVMTWDCRRKIESCLKDALKPTAEKYMPPLRKTADKWLLPHVRKDLMEEYVHWVMLEAFFHAESVLYYGMYDRKTLAIPEDFNATAAGICIFIP